MSWTIGATVNISVKYRNIYIYVQKLKCKKDKAGTASQEKISHWLCEIDNTLWANNIRKICKMWNEALWFCVKYWPECGKVHSMKLRLTIFFSLSINLPFFSWLTDLLFSISENGQNGHHNFLKPKVTSSKALFYQTNKFIINS